VDGGYAGRLVRWAERQTHIVLEVVKRRTEQMGFAVNQRRWVVERTFAWVVKNRRFHYEFFGPLTRSWRRDGRSVPGACRLGRASGQFLSATHGREELARHVDKEPT
jgi:transposase